jgi:hypothetical protein
MLLIVYFSTLKPSEVNYLKVEPVELSLIGPFAVSPALFSISVRNSGYLEPTAEK